MREQVTIGCWAGAWGDSPGAARQILDHPDLDYLVGDHLAEITMALLARARAKDPAAGYIPDVPTTLAPLLGEIAERGIKVVTNGGGLNPAACAQALRTAARAAGLSLRVAHVDGDDITSLLGDLRSRGATDLFTGEPLPEHALTANAYLGARPIATALAAGADIVVTGRCVDSAVVLGPLMHEFAWTDEDYDRLSAGTLVGHIVECGPQSLGGLFTDWESVPGWNDMGYPIAECRADGSAVITKPEGTGGLVTAATVGEQILYEIGDPGAYVMPDVICDWRDVTLVQEGRDRVRVVGARGSAPTDSYKVTVTSLDGFRLMSTVLFAGGDAVGRARRAGEAILTRGERVALAAGHGTLTERSIEVVGSGDLSGEPMRGANEAVLKVAARAADRETLDAIAREFASFGLIAQGMTGLVGGRPKPAPAIRLHHVLARKTDVPVTVVLDDESQPVGITAGTGTVSPTTPLQEGAPSASAENVRAPLRRIAFGRSGDKGNDANIGLIARRPELLPVLREQVTGARVAEVFAPWLNGPVTRWELPGMNAINILLQDVLGGHGGTSSIRYDPQGKSYAAILLDVEVDVPPTLLEEGADDATPQPADRLITSTNRTT